MNWVYRSRLSLNAPGILTKRDDRRNSILRMCSVWWGKRHAAAYRNVRLSTAPEGPLAFDSPGQSGPGAPLIRMGRKLLSMAAVIPAVTGHVYLKYLRAVAFYRWEEPKGLNHPRVLLDRVFF